MCVCVGGGGVRGWMCTCMRAHAYMCLHVCVCVCVCVCVRVKPCTVYINILVTWDIL